MATERIPLKIKSKILGTENFTAPVSPTINGGIPLLHIAGILLDSESVEIEAKINGNDTDWEACNFADGNDMIITNNTRRIVQMPPADYSIRAFFNKEEKRPDDETITVTI